MEVSKLEETFNLKPLVIKGDFTSSLDDKQVITVQDTQIGNPVKLDDSDYIRKNLKELADSTKDALDLALQMQLDDPNARNTEAVAKMADAVAKALGNLIHLNKTEKDEAYRSKEPEGPKTVNNNIIVTTTEDLISKIISQTKRLKEK